MKLINTIFIAIITLSIFTFSSCKKSEGEGGKASITGKIWVKRYNATGTVVAGEFAGAYEDVYIIYGSDATYGDKAQANPDGIYEFKYLRPGNYKIYAYSTGPSITVNRLAVIKEVEITEKKQTVECETIEVVK